MKWIIKYYIIYILFLLFMFWSFNLKADEFKLINLEQVSIDYLNFLPGGRTPLISNNGLTNRSPGTELDLNVNTTIAKYVYWNNTVTSLTDNYSDTDNSGQFRSVGLQLELGLRVTSWLDVYYHHFSEHMLDTTYNGGQFPILLDAVGVHLYLYRNNDKKESIF